MRKPTEVIQKDEQGFYSKAGKHFSKLMTNWLQETRLVAEACYRLRREYDNDPSSVVITKESWKKVNSSFDTNLAPLRKFGLSDKQKKICLDGLLEKMLASQFIFLETLWESYLSELSSELNTINPALFKECLDSKYIQDALNDALVGKIPSIKDLRMTIGNRFASMITRKSWDDQWKDLGKLGVGLSVSSEQSKSWYKSMAQYFEMRNLIIHAQGRVSDKLRELANTYDKHSRIIIYPQHIDFFRRNFLSCVRFIEKNIQSRLLQTGSSV